MRGRRPDVIEAAADSRQIRRVYDLLSSFYGSLVGAFERGTCLRALEQAGVQPRDRVLEVAVGPGSIFLEILRRLDRGNAAYGVDLSPKMLRKAKRSVSAAGYSNGRLLQADARRLPFRNGVFDLVYNSYMFDLLKLKDMPVVLLEFRRVLKPSGRLVIVSSSKETGRARTAWEMLYQLLPKAWVPYVLGGCRPVLTEGLVRQAGFVEVKRTFIRTLLSSEIVTAVNAGA